MQNIAKRLYNNKSMIITICLLAWPSVVDQALQTVVQYVGSAMVGRIGAQASAAVGLTTSVTWLINSPFFAMGVGVLAYISSSIGAREYDKAKKASVQSIIIMLALGTVVGLAALSAAPFLPKWLGASPEIQRDASLYFGIICLPMLFRSSSIIFSSVLRATGDMKTPMVVNLVMNAVNIILNFLLIYNTRTLSIGGFSFSLYGAGLGVTGAAIAAAVSYSVSGILMFVALYRNKLVSPKGEKIKLDMPIMSRCVDIGFPIALERVGLCLGYVVFSSLVTKLGTIALAAHSIAITAEQAFYIPGYGMQAAAATLVGNALGERDEKKLRNSATTTIWIAVAVMTITGTLLFLLPNQMMSIFTQDPDVIRAGAAVLRIVAVSEPMFGALVIFEGIFNGMGDTKVPFVFTMFCMWGVRIASTYLCISVFNLGLNAVWMCMIADNLVRFILLLIRFVRGSWKGNLQFE